MPNLRIASRGTRFVAMIQALPLIQYLRSKRPVSERITTAMMKDWAEGASKEDMADFISACQNMDNKTLPRPVCANLVNAGEVLYIPPGSLVFMRVVSAIDSLGVRVGFLSSGNLPLLETLQGMGGAPNAAMMQAVGCLQAPTGGGHQEANGPRGEEMPPLAKGEAVSATTKGKAMADTPTGEAVSATPEAKPPKPEAMSSTLASGEK